MSYRIDIAKHEPSVILPGHALFRIERESQFGDAWFVCECGEIGLSCDSSRMARADHRQHKIDLIAAARGGAAANG